MKTFDFSFNQNLLYTWQQRKSNGNKVHFQCLAQDIHRHPNTRSPLHFLVDVGMSMNIVEHRIHDDGARGGDVFYHNQEQKCIPMPDEIKTKLPREDS